MKEAHLIYYSPALSTRRIIRTIGKELGLTTKEHDITQGISEPLSFSADDLVVFGIPVYSGRVPASAVEHLQQIKGSSTPAILICVYGNREYDDALLELKDISQANGFIPVAAAAFVARHSIFPNIAKDRPDEEDKQCITDFVQECLSILQASDYKTKDLKVRGNHPYREPSKIPFAPKGDKKCDECGTCVKMCPMNAIPADHPRQTDKNLCISCARCIAVCPQHSRKFEGLIYKVARRKFESSYTTVRKKPEFFF